MKYPNKINKKFNKDIPFSTSFKNKGDNLEYDINLANNYYNSHGIALIHKKPTPIKVIDINNDKRPIITKAFFQTPSTTDYNGIYRGKYIDFEAKETSSTTSFPLSNIHSHQIEHLRSVCKLKGIAFIIILFTNLNKVYLLEIDMLDKYLNQTNKKSISIKFLEKNAHEINYNFHPRIDYLKIVDIVYFGGFNES